MPRRVNIGYRNTLGMHSTLSRNVNNFAVAKQSHPQKSYSELFQFQLVNKAAAAAAVVVVVVVVVGVVVVAVVVEQEEEEEEEDEEEEELQVQLLFLGCFASCQHAKRISGTDLLRQLSVLSNRDNVCRSSLLSHPVVVN